MLFSFAVKARNLRTRAFFPLTVGVMGSQRLLSNSAVSASSSVEGMTDKKLKGLATADLNSDEGEVKGNGGKAKGVEQRKNDNKEQGTNEGWMKWCATRVGSRLVGVKPRISGGKPKKKKKNKISWVPIKIPKRVFLRLWMISLIIAISKIFCFHAFIRMWFKCSVCEIQEIMNEPGRINAMMVQQLKAALQNAGLPAKGCKSDLVSALNSYLDKQLDGESSHLGDEQLSSISAQSISVTGKTKTLSGELDAKIVMKWKKPSIKANVSEKRPSQAIRKASFVIDDKDPNDGVNVPTRQSEPWTIFAHKKP
ncbi:hypothetical protein SLEP1_g55668 [Rubroshorea leprosula]|uniref:SAP domain-containing protein n=1 Tax=Rubroshorea leprosula TaxID=152421 RepID=A0AAV5MIL1_9ROSI|nr:hypothetical protein SLEP1_g55668 [Rubroshorea leprosula]